MNQEEVADMKEDAKRYNWIIAGLDRDGNSWYLPYLHIKDGDDHPTKKEVDAVVDIAIVQNSLWSL